MWDWLVGEGSWGSEILKNIVGMMLQGVTEAIKVVATWWIALPAPILESTASGAVLTPAERVQEYTGWAVTLVGLIATMFALLLIARNRKAENVVQTFEGLFRVIMVSAVAIPGTWSLLKFSDVLSPWLLDNISGGTFEDGLGKLTGGDAAAAAGMGVGTLVLLLVVLVISIIGAILNMVLVMFSFGALPAVVGLLPVAAAYAMSERGRVAFNKTVGWLAALVLFKPVAAVIYGVGIASARMISGGVEDAGQVVLQSLYGGIVLAAAGIALPVLIRLIAPAAAAGSQGAGGGGLLVGAAMVAVGAVTGGASAAAGAASSGGGGGAAASTGAATSGASNATGASTSAATTGTSGTAGTSGTSGSSGSTGSSGTSGTSGSSGSGGTDGTAGTQGSTGNSGTSGKDGSAGTTGATGTGGQAGTSGDSGSAGTAGQSGANGSNGSQPASAPAPDTTAPTAPAERSGSTWAQRWQAEGAQHIRSQGSLADRAAEQGDDR